MTQEEKIKDLEQRIAMMDADSSALCTDLKHWKKVAAGLKGRNKQLSERVEHYRQLDLEGGELYEKRLAEIDRLKSIIEEKDRTIAGLQSQITELNKRISNNEKNIQDLTGERDVAIANYDYVCGLPWYQRMFFKCK